MKRKLFLMSFFVAVFLVLAVITPNVGVSASAASEEKTGVGLSEHVLKAYRENWQYRSGCYGQFVNGRRATDCSGLVKSYLWWTGEKTNPSSKLMSVAGSSSAMLRSAKVSGTIKYSDSSSLPRVHGLILYQPGHVGVYVGNNMAVDNRESGVNIKYEKVFGRSSPKWTKWFKLPQITYPTTGLVTFDGKEYYYENGQYIVNANKLIDGIPYHFDSAGVGTPL
ncbi:MAG: NlpC/P60 family protein [Ruminococcaceae bacterium]|nr:NlpC/P60 family protein [Oscillospiraceae bacterium]